MEVYYSDGVELALGSYVPTYLQGSVGRRRVYGGSLFCGVGLLFSRSRLVGCGFLVPGLDGRDCMLVLFLFTFDEV